MTLTVPRGFHGRVGNNPWLLRHACPECREVAQARWMTDEAALKDMFAFTIECGKKFVWRQNRKHRLDDHSRPPMDHRDLYECRPHLEPQPGWGSKRSVEVSLDVVGVHSIGAQARYLADGRVVEPVRTGSRGKPLCQGDPDILSIHMRRAPPSPIQGTTGNPATSSLLASGDRTVEELRKHDRGQDPCGNALLKKLGHSRLGSWPCLSARCPGRHAQVAHHNTTQHTDGTTHSNSAAHDASGPGACAA